MNWLLHPRAFDIAIVLMFIGAAIRWAFAGDWVKALYWTGAVILNIAVAFMGGK